MSAVRKSAKVIRLRPRRFDSRERLIEIVSEAILIDGRPYSKIAMQCYVSPATVGRIARRQTMWPKYSTLFPLLDALGLKIEIVGK